MLNWTINEVDIILHLVDIQLNNNFNVILFFVFGTTSFSFLGPRHFYRHLRGLSWRPVASGWERLGAAAGVSGRPALTLFLSFEGPWRWSDEVYINMLLISHIRVDLGQGSNCEADVGELFPKHANEVWVSFGSSFLCIFPLFCFSSSSLFNLLSCLWLCPPGE